MDIKTRKEHVTRILKCIEKTCHTGYDTNTVNDLNPMDLLKEVFSSLDSPLFDGDNPQFIEELEASTDELVRMVEEISQEESKDATVCFVDFKNKTIN